MTLDEAYAKSEALANYSEQLVADRKALNIAIEAFLAQVEADIKHAKVFLAKFEAFRKEYVTLTKTFTDQLEHLKNLRELKEWNQKLMEQLTK